MFDLRMSEGAKPLFEKVKAFIKDEVEPITKEFRQLGEGRTDPWSYAPGQLELLDGVKAKAKASGLWNFFLPDAATGEGLSNLDYAYIATELGKNGLADGPDEVHWFVVGRAELARWSEDGAMDYNPKETFFAEQALSGR